MVAVNSADNSENPRIIVVFDNHFLFMTLTPNSIRSHHLNINENHSHLCGVNLTRRHSLQQGAALAAMLGGLGILPPQAQAAWNEKAFDASTPLEALKRLGYGAPQMSRDISLTAPDMADNGASVQISCATSLPDAVKLMVLVEKNQHPLCAVFELTEQVEPNWVMRIKMAQSSWVWAVVVTRAGSVFFAQKDIRVTIGGCGE